MHVDNMVKYSTATDLIILKSGTFFHPSKHFAIEICIESIELSWSNTLHVFSPLVHDHRILSIANTHIPQSIFSQLASVEFIVYIENRASYTERLPIHLSVQFFGYRENGRYLYIHILCIHRAYRIVCSSDTNITVVVQRITL